jgi:Tol biopolymer transport system component/DNA-binding winged helix-turn-helix (wHTH) protein
MGRRYAPASEEIPGKRGGNSDETHESLLRKFEGNSGNRMPNQVNGLYEFGSFRLNSANRLLSRAGETVTLAPKTLDLLLLLVEGEGRVLTKRELMNALWADTFVEEASLSYQIAALRKALGKDGDEWIETVPKHGYRFTATVTKVTGDGVRPDESTGLQPAPNRLPRRLAPWLIAFLTTLIAVVFAVLYFRQPSPSEQSIRFLVSPPEKVVLADRVPAVSPDGARLAFVGIEPDAKLRLWVRSLSSLTAEPVLGSEGAVSVFWSPDSRSVGFFAGGKLRRSDLRGAPPQNLCDVSDTARPVGTWSRDGMILFNSEDRHGLYRVAATGGEPSPVTTFDPSRQEVLHAWPQFLPDGRHFIYLVQSARPENTGIYVGSLDSRASKRVLNTSANPSYAGLPSGIGYLLFMQATTLMARPFDARRLESQGEAFPVAEQVLLPPAPAQGFATYSVSGNGALAYRTFGQATTELVWFDRKGNRVGRVGEPANYSLPALSPDEKRLAVARIDPQIGTKDVWLFDLPSEKLSRFTFDPAEETNPTWSPDGSRIAFSSSEKGNSNIYQKAATGTGKAEPVLESSDRQIIQDWSPDGRFIFYDSGGNLWALPLNGDRKQVVLFAVSGESRLKSSPDTKWLAYQSSESGRTEIYVQSFPPSGSKWQVSTVGGEEPYWRRDGRELFYVAGKQLMVVDVKTDGQVFHSGVPRPLFDVRLEMESRRRRYQVAANGQRFLVNVPLESTLSAPITVVTNWTAGLKR